MPARSLVAAGGIAVMAVCGCSADDGRASGPPTHADAVGAAQTLCPVMWQWVKDVGSTFNDAAEDVAAISDPTERRARWYEQLDDVVALNARLLDDLAGMRSDPLLAPLVEEVERDVPLAAAELDDIRTLISESPEVDEGRHQDRTVQVIVRLEKVIDLPKPELAGIDVDGLLIPAFREVPSCQQAVKDVDDGSTQANG